MRTKQEIVLGIQSITETRLKERTKQKELEYKLQESAFRLPPLPPLPPEASIHD